jgi:hypothetical protein
MNIVKESLVRAAIASNPDATPVCADFPDPQQQPGAALGAVGADDDAATDYAEVPEITARFGDRTFDAPYTVIRSVGSARHGRTGGGPAPSSSRTDRDRFEECGGRHRAKRASVDG